MSGADAGVSFRSSHYLDRHTTATVISTSIGGAWPGAEVVDAHIKSAMRAGTTTRKPIA